MIDCVSVPVPGLNDSEWGEFESEMTVQKVITQSKSLDGNLI